MSRINDPVFIGIFRGIQQSVRKGKSSERKWECDWKRFAILADRLDEIDSPLGFLAKYFRLDKFKYLQFLPNKYKAEINDYNVTSVLIENNLIKIEMRCEIGTFILKADF